MTLLKNYQKQSGRDYRKNNRRKREIKTREKGIYFAEQLIEKYQFNTQAIVDKEIYELTLSSINEEIAETLKKGKESLYARTVIRDQAQNILNVHRLDVALPSAQTVLGTIKSAYTFDSASKAASLHRWDKAFKKLTKSKKRLKGLNKDEWLALSAFSFIRHSFQLNPHMVTLFVQKICSQDKVFEYQDGSIWVNLVSPAPSDHGHTCFNVKTKVEGGEDKLALSKLVPLNLTTTILAKKAIETSNSDLLNENNHTLFTMIRTTLFGENYTDKNIKNIKELCEAVEHKVIICEDSGISPMLAKTSRHLVASVCLNPTNWASLNTQPKKIPSPYRSGNLTSDLIGDFVAKKTKKTKPVNLGDFYQELEKATQVRDSTSEDLNLLRRRLKKLVEAEGMQLSILTMVQWVISLSEFDPARKFGKKGDLAPRTIRDYCRLFASRWILAVGDDDIADYTAEDFIEVYEQMINETDLKIDDPQNILPSLIIRFNDYVARKYNHESETQLELPDNIEVSAIMGGTGKKSLFIRARIISHQHVTAILNHLDQLSQHSKQFKLIVMIAWRCGLRIGEILRLRPCDYEFGWLYVRKNRYGLQKSHAAGRRVNLMALLSDAELELFLPYLMKMSSIDAEGLLFSPGFNMKWKGPKVAKYITTLMREISGDENLVFHNFRDSAASTVHCAIEEAWETAIKISGHSREKLVKIKQAIVGINRERDIYWCLAVFLGHASPLESMRSYCHLSPFIIHSKLTKKPLQLSTELICFIGGIDDDKNFSSEKSWNKHLADANPHLFTHYGSLNYKSTNEWNGNTGNNATISDIHAFLKWIEDGKSYSIGLKHFHLSDEEAKRHLTNAIYLYFLLSRKGGHRLFSNKRKRASTPDGMEFLLLPAYFSDPDLQKQIYRAIDTLRADSRAVSGSARKEKLKNLKNWCLEIISRANSRPELSIKDLGIASMIINTAHPALNEDNWDIIIYHYDDNKEEILKIWKDIVRRPNTRTESLGKRKQALKNKEGFAHLNYKPDTDNQDELAYKIPVILAHMLMIMMGQKNDFDKLKIDKVKAEQLLEYLIQS